MKVPVANHFRSSIRRAFSVLELLVAVGLLSLIVLALYAMFDQTQKALHASIGQVDVMEGGRSAMDLIARDLARAQSPNLPATPGDPAVTNINLAIRKREFTKQGGGTFQPPGVDDSLHRDFPLNELFFQIPLAGNRWTGVGFFVALTKEEFVGREFAALHQGERAGAAESASGVGCSTPGGL